MLTEGTAADDGSTSSESTPGGGMLSAGISTKKFAFLLSAINTSQKMDENLAEFCTELHKGQENTATRVLKHAHL